MSDQTQIRAQLAAHPDIKTFVKELFDAGMIDGLRDVLRIIPVEQADAEWRSQPGYIQLPPFVPARRAVK